MKKDELRRLLFNVEEKKRLIKEDEGGGEIAAIAAF